MSLLSSYLTDRKFLNSVNIHKQSHRHFMTWQLVPPPFDTNCYNKPDFHAQRHACTCITESSRNLH